MRVLWVCGARAAGGAENASLQLAQLLRARGHAVEVLCRRGTDLGRAVARAGLPVHDAPLGGGLSLCAWRALAAVLRQRAPHIALVTTVDEWVWACLAQPRQSKTALVLVRHMILPLPWAVRSLANRRADAVVAVSEAVRRSSLDGIRPDLVHVIPVASRFAPRADVPAEDERLRARAALAVPPTGRCVAFLGGLNRAKGIEDVCRAVSDVARALGETHLLVCGPQGDGRGSNRRPELGAGGRLHYLGNMARVEIALTAAEVVVLATHATLGEAMPLTLLEAMACGTPVAAYAIGGVPEIIGADGGAGRLVRPDDAHDLARVLTEILADPPAARRLAGNGLRRLRDHFDPERMADRWEGLLQATRQAKRTVFRLPF